VRLGHEAPIAERVVAHGDGLADTACGLPRGKPSSAPAMPGARAEPSVGYLVGRRADNCPDYKRRATEGESAGNRAQRGRRRVILRQGVK
jgi:hypothetical protein